MKRSKKLAALLLVLVLVLGAAYAATTLSSGNETAEEETPAAAVFTLDVQTVTALSWDYSEKLSFEKRDGAWVYTGDAAFPLDESYIDTVLDTLSEITSSKTIEAVEDWDQYTLEVPVCGITVTAGGVTHTLKIGAETAMGGERYFSIGDGNAYLVDADVVNAFSYGLYDLLAWEAIPDMTYLHGLKLVSEGQSYEISLLENSGLAYTDAYVWFLEGMPLDSELTETLLSNVAYLSWEDCVDYHAADLGKYGLDPPAAVVTAYYTQMVETATNETDEDGNPVYETREKEASFTLEIGGETGDYRYARIAGSDMVYKIDAAVADALMYTTRYELLPDEVLLMDWEQVTAMDITLDGVSCRFEKGTETVTDEEGNTSETVIWLRDGEEVDMDTITGALDNLTSSGYATGLSPERTEQIRFTIYRDHDTFPAVELAFYQYDSASCLATLNGEATVFTNREAVAALTGEVNSLISGI